MIKFFKLKRLENVLKHIWWPLIIISAINMFVQIAMTFLPETNLIFKIVDNSHIAINIFNVIVLCPFITYSISKKDKEVNAFFSIVYAVLFESVFESMTGTLGGIFVAIFIGIVTGVIFNQFKNYKLTVFLLFILTFIFSIVFGILYEYYYELLLVTSERISNSRASALYFGWFSPLSSIFIGGNEFNNMFYQSSFGGTLATNTSIINGAKSIFEYQFLNGLRIGDYASKYLCGNYITSVFITFGFTLSFFPFFNKKEKEFKLLLATTILCALSGNLIPYLIMLLFLNPLTLVAFIGVSGLSYLFLSFLYINIGFLNSGGVLEFLNFGINSSSRYLLVLFVGGCVFLVLSFSLSRMIARKFGVSTEINATVINSNVVKKLGGIKNIKSFKAKHGRIYVYVKNGNLINITIQNDYFCVINGDMVLFKFKNFEQYNKFYNSIMVIKEYI